MRAGATPHISPLRSATPLNILFRWKSECTLVGKVEGPGAGEGGLSVSLGSDSSFSGESGAGGRRGARSAGDAELSSMPRYPLTERSGLFLK